MKKTIVLFFVIFLLSVGLAIGVSAAEGMSDKLSGRILLQVEGVGQAWYLAPGSGKRAFLGRPADAFRIMRELGLGISENDYSVWGDTAPGKLSGKILLRVEASGEAYYVNPLDMKMHYLGRPADAFDVMRSLGLGISDNDLGTIDIDENYEEIDYTPPTDEESTEEGAGEEEEEVEEVEEPIEEEVTEEPATSTEEVSTSTEEVAEEESGCELTASYYLNEDLTRKMFERTEYGIDQDWGTGGPEGLSKTDKFSVMWVGSCSFEAGTYRFTGEFDDGVQATIAGKGIHDYFKRTGGLTFTKDLEMEEGEHQLRVEYFEYVGDAVAKLSWEKVVE